MSEPRREKSWQAGPLRVRVQLPDDARSRRPKERLTVERIVDTAMDLMAEKGYDAVSMRSLAKALDTGPASLYAHVANKEQLDQLVLDRVIGEFVVPAPEADRWQEQTRQILRDMLALYRRHPGSARASMGMIPAGWNFVRVLEDILAVLAAGGVSPQAAAWFCDLAPAYVSAVAVEEDIWRARENSTAAGVEPDQEAIDADLSAYLESLPAQHYPLITSMVRELAAGDGQERFEFGVDVLVAGLAAVSEKYR